MPNKLTVPERFWSKVNRSGPVPAYAPHLGNCWLWTGSRDRKGYGHFYSVSTSSNLAHRWSYEDAYGPMPDGLQSDHLCRVTSCVRPSHIEAVTSKVNTERGLVPIILPERFRAYNKRLREAGQLSPGSIKIRDMELAKTHCPAGHPYDEENTYRAKRGRACRACHRRKERERQNRIRVTQQTAPCVGA